MKKASIRMLPNVLEQVRKNALGNTMNESVAFLTANYFESNDVIILLGEKVVPAKQKDYLNRGELHLEVSPLYISRVLNHAEDTDSTIIMTHSHPFDNGKPQYSMTDDLGEARTSETISNCLLNNPPVGSLLFGQQDMTARVWLGLSKKYMPADVTILNEKNFKRYHDVSSNDYNDRKLIDRQIKALGNQTQNYIESFKIGIVGLGGTGSSIAEQLVRMGVKDFILVDYDLFEPSNWSRVYGSTIKDISNQRLKTEIVASHIKLINPDVSCNIINKSVMTKEVLHTLASCDIVFSCLDRHAPRAVLNELSYQCYIPVIDVGVGLIREENNVLGGSVRATIIGPNLPCLYCQELIRSEMITAEHLSPDEYESRRAEGYVNDLEQNVPSVISYTTLASSFGINLFLDYISGNNTTYISTLLFDINSKDTMKLRSSIKSDCVCQKRLGQGLRMPFSVAD